MAAAPGCGKLYSAPALALHRTPHTAPPQHAGCSMAGAAVWDCEAAAPRQMRFRRTGMLHHGASQGFDLLFCRGFFVQWLLAVEASEEASFCRGFL